MCYAGFVVSFPRCIKNVQKAQKYPFFKQVHFLNVFAKNKQTYIFEKKFIL